jgi:plasmid replication initiation protein
MQEEMPSWQKQPDLGTVVWQHNRLAEARYELTAREQKLLLYVIAMIEPEDDQLKRYVVNVSEFAELARLDKDHLYQELRDLAQSLKRKPLVIPNHFDSVTGRHVDLVTSWFDSAMIARTGAGYFAVTISSDLKGYLLQVKREFFRFRLFQVMQMRSSYAIRLYQWLKRWEFRHAVEISVAELRIHIGASGVDERGKPKENLALYPDFKRRAIRPAIDEINKRTDLRVTFSEIKANGSKAVERLRFAISTKAGRPDVELLPLAPPPQLELGLENGSADLLNDVCERFGLNEAQRQKVHSYVIERGAAYLHEKLAVVAQEPRNNSAKALLAALRDDWKLAVEIKRQPREKMQTLNGDSEQKIAMSPEQGREAAKVLRFARRLKWNPDIFRGSKKL